MAASIILTCSGVVVALVGLTVASVHPDRKLHGSEEHIRLEDTRCAIARASNCVSGALLCICGAILILAGVR